MFCSLKSEVTLTEELRELYSIIESTENQITKHKRAEYSMSVIRL